MGLLARSRRGVLPIMAAHRVPVMNVSLNRHPDPERSSDPRIRELVAALGVLSSASAPDTRFRAELRAQLVAATPRIVAEQAAAATTETVSAARSRWLRLGRPLSILTCALVIGVLLLSGAFWISSRALPGDALYGLKRASENFRAAVTGGDADRGKLLLSYAATRYDEIGDLLPKSGALGAGVQAGGVYIDSHTASLVTSTLNAADDEVRQGMQTIGAQAIESNSGTVLAVVVDWYPAPMRSLTDIVARIPIVATDGLHQRAAQSLALLTDAALRANSLQALGDCECLASVRTDGLGPVAPPCATCVPPATKPAPSPSPTPSPSPSSSATPAPGTSGAATTDPGSAAPPAPAESTDTLGPIVLPPLPVDTAAPPPPIDPPPVVTDTPTLPTDTPTDTSTGTPSDTSTDTATAPPTDTSTASTDTPTDPGCPSEADPSTCGPTPTP